MTSVKTIFTTLLIAAPTLVYAEEAAAPANSSMFAYLLEGGVVVLGTLIILLVLSVICWTLIGIKASQFNRALSATRKLERKYESAGTLAQVAGELSSHSASPLAEMIKASFGEIEAQPPGTGDHNILLSNVQRVLKRKARIGLAKLEQNLGFLATVASASPFIGLFGTVWGIMDAFAHIRADQPILTTVAPHIAHALIATGVGLATAIPAVMAYNFFVGKLKGLALQLDSFADDLMLRLNRSSPVKAEHQTPPNIPKAAHAPMHEVG